MATVLSCKVRMAFWARVWACMLCFGVLGMSLAMADAPSGRMLVRHHHSPSGEYRDLQVLLKDSGLFEDIAGSLNATLFLPQDLLVHVQECGEENAFYDPEAREITVCYELIDRYMSVFSQQEKTAEATLEKTLDASALTLYHEVGHALVDLLNVPQEQRSEEVMDAFTAMVVLQQGIPRKNPDVPDIAETGMLPAVSQFADSLRQPEDKLGRLTFWQEHTLTPRRLEVVSCLIYGSSPEHMTFLKGDGRLSPELAENCQAEYQKTRVQWQNLLSTYLKSEVVTSQSLLAPAVGP